MKVSKMSILNTMNSHIKYCKFLISKVGYRFVYHYLTQCVAFDLKNGTDTSLWVQNKDYPETTPHIDHGVCYQSCFTDEVVTALDFVSKRFPIDRATFFDIGCGKGKALMLARKYYGFKNAVGVEYNSDLLEIANKNIQKLQLDGIRLIHTDAQNFTDFSNINIVYMYHPFDAEIARKVKRNMEASGKPCILIYNNPWHVNIFENWDVINIKKGSDQPWNTTILGYGLNSNENKIPSQDNTPLKQAA